jgi:hypothetical protein
VIPRRTGDPLGTSTSGRDLVSLGDRCPWNELIRPREQELDLGGEEGIREEEALSGHAARPPEFGELFGKLDAFGDDVEMQRSGESEDGPHEDRASLGIFGHPANECPIDLQLIEWELPEIPQGR